MADYIVVGAVPENSLKDYANGYRGVDRDYIQFPFEFYGTNHEILALNSEYESITEAGFVHDIGFATKLRDVYNSAYPDTNREIIEVVSFDEKPNAGKTFLGFDIIDGSNSNILRLILPYAKGTEIAEDNLFQRLFRIFSKNFYSLLNSNELFDDYKVACVALGIIDGLLDAFDEKSAHHLFEVKKIYLV